MITLRAGQEKAIDLIWRYFDNNQGNPLLEAPTGSGKSMIQAGFIKRAVETFPQTRVLCLTHVKELIEQNSQAMRRMKPDCDIGIHSAGLGQRDTDNKVIFAGIQSAYPRRNELGRFDLIFVDEAHLVPAKLADGQYRKFLDRMRDFNPKVKVIGLTATPYRLDGGLLTVGEHRLFTDLISAETAGMSIPQLIKEGYLAPLTTAPVSSHFEADGIKLSGGDFIAGALSKAVMEGDTTERACDELITLGANRRSWLVFATSVDHAERVRDYLQGEGIEAALITGETPAAIRQRRIADFRAGRLRAIVNVNVLTTGFDAPGTDLIAFMRPTASTGLYVQCLGRGMRIADGKTDCLVLDFAGNIERHGPVDKVRPRLKRGQGNGSPPMRECPECGCVMAAAVRVCPDCGEVFITGDPDLEHVPSFLPVLSTDESRKTFTPSRVRVHIHRKNGSPDMLRVDWYAGIRKMASEWICLFHDGYPARKAAHWWFAHVGGSLPSDIDEALERAQNLRKPESITVFLGGKFPEVESRRMPDMGVPASSVPSGSRGVTAPMSTHRLPPVSFHDLRAGVKPAG